jgi:pimeloyl-ACP methyl ester carboxylesterase
MRAYVDFWYGGGAWERTGASLKTSLVRQVERVALDLAASLALSRSVARLRDVRCPTLAVVGLESPVACLRVTEIVAEAIPGARLTMISGAGHMAPLTDPHIVDPLIAAHLRAVDGLDRAVWNRAA